MPAARPLAVVPLAILALAACTDPPERREKRLVEEAAPRMDTTIVSLAPLTEGDITEHPLAGELGCSFTNAQGDLVLLAKGDVGSTAPAQALAKSSVAIDRLTAPGGYDGITGGATFTGPDKTLTVAIKGPAIGGGESPPRPAALTYARPNNGASQTFEGRWTCGP
ncbi:MAG: hypothetical protein J0I28_10000 [Caulobacterales bacterium]|nr:hypothetical protein [Caulobacterales bacterium]